MHWMLASHFSFFGAASHTIRHDLLQFDIIK